MDTDSLSIIINKDLIDEGVKVGFKKQYKIEENGEFQGRSVMKNSYKNS